MKIREFQSETWLPLPPEELFPFFANAANLDAITPPWLHFNVLTPPPIVMRAGALIDYRLRVRGIPLRWLTVIEEWNPPYEFVDVQAKGPYQLWHHTHRFTEVEGGTAIADTVRYQLPFGPLGQLVHAMQVKGDIKQVFDYRASQVPAKCQ